MASVEEISHKFGGISIERQEEQRNENDAIRLAKVERKKDFKSMERVNGRWVNVLEGLELHTGIFNATEQQEIVNHVYEIQEMGRQGKLRERTYSEPRKWMRGKGRVTIQFGCCYNYAMDKNGNPPGIIRDEEVDPIPPLLKKMIKRMVMWRVLPPTCVPNSCIINIYDKDDCIPPHIDHHDFIRPFCTVSFLSECNILFGRDMKVLGPGDFSGSTSIPLPVGSVLVLKGNGADLAKHCVPAVPSERISITFRKMDDTKLPIKFRPDPELINLHPLPLHRKSLGNPVITPTPVTSSPVHSSPVTPTQTLPHKLYFNTHPRENRTTNHFGTHRQVGTPPNSKMENKASENEREAMNQVWTPPPQIGGQQLKLNTHPRENRVERENLSNSFQLGSDEFPPLGLSMARNKPARASR